MLSFIINNIGTILISICLLLIFAGIIIYLVIQKKKGNSSCSCSCADCAMKGSCHSQRNK